MATLDKEIEIIMLKGETGGTIENIEKTSTSGNVDTYTIYTNDGDTYTFTVTNGTSIESIEKTSTSGNVDTYTITLTNGDTSTFTVTNGEVTLAQLETAVNGLQSQIDNRVINGNNASNVNITTPNGYVEIKSIDTSDDNEPTSDIKVNNNGIEIISGSYNHGLQENEDYETKIVLTDSDITVNKTHGNTTESTSLFKKLYKHDIQIHIPYAQNQDEYGTVIITLYTSSDTPITTLNEIKSYIKAGSSDTPSIPAGGTLEAKNGNACNITHLELFSGSLIAVYLYYNSSNYWQTVDCYIDNRNPTISDGVTQIY